MQFRIIIDCDNEAFGEDSAQRRGEIARILRSMGASLLLMDDDEIVTIRDSNGNTVGKAEFIDA